MASLAFISMVSNMGKFVWVAVKDQILLLLDFDGYTMQQ
jgi:hypothetical protein